MLLAAAGLPGDLSAQTPLYRPPQDFFPGGKADQAEGARILAEFRRLGIRGGYWLAFDLRVMPRRGTERLVHGQLLGTRNESGPVSRLTLPGAHGLASERRWLIQSGPQPTAWTWDGAAAQTRQLGVGDAFQPVGDTDLTLFDLQMPFLYWNDFVYEGLAKVRGRPANSFVLYPPKDLAAARPQLTGVRVLLDTQFGALVQAELLGEKGRPEKSITVLDLKKTGEQWIVKEIDLRNLVTRDKTRFTVTAAALDLILPPTVWSADGLAAEAPVVAEDAIQRF